MHTLSFQQDFSAPPEKVFAYFAEHENLSSVFAPMRIERVRDGDSERNGVGSVRKLSLFGALPFEETTTAVVPNERIEYRITKGSPLRRHFGVMVFSATEAGGTHLDYTISFEGKLPGIGAAVAAGLNQGVSKGLKKATAEI